VACVVYLKWRKPGSLIEMGEAKAKAKGVK
jgi:hypothetical protein